MSRDELLQMLQEKGMDDDAIKALLKDVLDTLDHQFEEHDDKEEEKEEMAEDEEEKKAAELLGVDL